MLLYNQREGREGKNMTRKEILDRIDEIETARFYLAMKDHWNREDFEQDGNLFEEWAELKRKLKEKIKKTLDK